MGRLAVILGSNALGPGGEEIAAAAAEHGAAIVPAPRRRRAPTSSPTAIDHAANLRRCSSRAATGCWRSARSARCAPSWRSAASSAPTTSSPCSSASSSFADARAHTAAGLRPRVARARCSPPGEAGGQALRDGGVYWQTIGPRFETPAEIRADRRPRRPGRDDDRLGVRRRRRARARLRGGLRGRQPRQRDRRPGRSASRSWKRDRAANAARGSRERPATALPAGAGGDGGRRAAPDGRPAPSSTASRSACAARTGGSRARPGGRRRSPATRRSTPAGAPLVAAARQRPHPRGDDALPRLRRRPAADALAAGEDLAGRGEARGRGRLLGNAAGLR